MKYYFEKMINFLYPAAKKLNDLYEIAFKPQTLLFVVFAVILAILIIASAARRSFGAGMPPANNIPIPQTRSHRKDYQALALKIYKKVFKLDEKIQKLKVASGLPPSKAREISKPDKKIKK